MVLKKEELKKLKNKMNCKCGCGLETTAKCGFYKGHWNKGRKRVYLTKRNIENNCSKNPIVSKKAGETKRKNGYIPWNREKNEFKCIGIIS